MNTDRILNAAVTAAYFLSVTVATVFLVRVIAGA